MPVTARLSSRFYDKFGDDIVNELVEWLNQVDLAYRSELREQNELNFARFDAKLDQRAAELKSEVEKRLAEFKGDVTRELARIDQRITQSTAVLDQHIAESKAEVIKWMFLFWAGTALAGLLLRR